MSCCGQKRNQWQQSMRPSQASVDNTDPVIENPVKLQYHGRGTIMVKGEITGNLYMFTEGEAALTVDGRDVPGLLRAGKGVQVVSS